MPVMSPAELMTFLGEHFPQAAHLGLAIEHLDDRTIRLRSGRVVSDSVNDLAGAAQ